MKNPEQNLFRRLKFELFHKDNLSPGRNWRSVVGNFVKIVDLLVYKKRTMT